MKVQMGQPSGISSVAAQADWLSSDDMITDLNEGTVLSEVGVSGDGAVCVANLDPVGLMRISATTPARAAVTVVPMGITKS
jgi:hypothetical protein